MTPLKAGIVTLSTNKALEMAEAERAQLLNRSRANRSLQRNLLSLPNTIGRFKELIEGIASGPLRAGFFWLLGKSPCIRNISLRKVEYWSLNIPSADMFS